MKAIIHYEVNNVEDSFVVSGDNKEELLDEVNGFFEERGVDMTVKENREKYNLWSELT